MKEERRAKRDPSVSILTDEWYLPLSYLPIQPPPLESDMWRLCGLQGATCEKLVRVVW